MPVPTLGHSELMVAADAMAAFAPAGNAPVHLITTYSVTSVRFGSSTTTLFGTC